MLTEGQKQFIRDNRLKISPTDFKYKFKVTYEVIKEFMISENLTITQEQSNAIRAAKMKRTSLKKTQSGWVADPWNHNLNSITMDVAVGGKM